MKRRPPRSTRTDTLFPYTTLFRSRGRRKVIGRQHGPLVAFGLPLVQVVRADLDSRFGPCFGSGVRIGGSTVDGLRSEEHTSELQSLMRISYAVFCLKKKKKQQ